MADSYTNLNADNAVFHDLTKFQGFYNNIYRDPFVNGTAFVFITKPLLFINYAGSTRDAKKQMAYINMTRDPFFTQFIAEQNTNVVDRKLVEMLCYDETYNVSNFMPIFTNQCKAFDSMDTQMDGTTLFDTTKGFAQQLPNSTAQSEVPNSVSLTLTEDQHLTFIRLLSLWIKYINNITDGTFDANPDMIRDGILDYMSSIYYFVLSPDGRSLKYWAKYTGCWPMNIPTSPLRYSKGSHEAMDIDVSFQYQYKEDMNPKILEEFNMCSLKLLNKQEITQASYTNSGLYSSIRESKFLTYKRLSEDPNVENLLKSPDRDPIILFKEGNNKGILTDKTEDHFELLFNEEGYTSFIDTEIFNSNNYYINDAATSNVEGSKQWNQSDFWATEEL